MDRPEWALTPDERRSLREGERRRAGAHRRGAVGCVWVGFLGSMVLGVAAISVFVWLVLAVIGWLNRH